MKKILILAAMTLAWLGTANAGELKVQIPVNDYEQIQSRLDSLESENNRLRQEVSSLENSSSAQASSQPVVNSEPSEEMLSRLSDLESENNRLKQEVDSLQNSQAQTAAAPVETDSEIEARLTSLEKQNLRLKRKIKAYKDSGMRVLDNDRRSARHIFRDMQRGK